MTRLLCMRLGASHPAQTSTPAYCETGRLSQANIWSSLLSGSAETWWNSSTAIRRSSKFLDAEFLHGEAESRVGADQHLIVAGEVRADPIGLAAVVRAGCGAQIAFPLNRGVGPPTERRQ